MSALPRHSGSEHTARPRVRLAAGRVPLAWLGVLPFVLYVSLFLILPTIWLALDAFGTDSGGYTLQHVQDLMQQQYLQAYWTSIKLSVVTALVGGLFGFFVAYTVVQDGAPRLLRPLLTTFSGVAANFAGVPLAFAFVATVGSAGVLTRFLLMHGVDLYGSGFTLFGFTGLALTYTYFQLPLMLLIISPSLDGVRREWREAATSLGANSSQFWRYVGLPILMPSLLGAMILLFGNAFAAYATAYALSGGSINLVPILIGAVLSGNILSDPHLGDALGLGMIVVIGVSVMLYSLLTARANRWSR